MIKPVTSLQVDSKAAELNLTGVASNHVGIAHTRSKITMIMDIMFGPASKQPMSINC